MRITIFIARNSEPDLQELYNGSGEEEVVANIANKVLNA
jgi:hypothetical protein